MKKAKIIGTIVGVILFTVVIAGITYAYTVWSSGNINRLVRSECFNVHYEKGSELNGAIVPSFDYTGGLYATVKMNISNKCNVNAKGRLYLDTGEETSSNLFRSGLLNYAVLRNGNTVIASGNITSTGEIAIDVGRLASTEYAFTRYEVYVWIDYNLVENSDINSVYYGNIRAEAIQEEGDFESTESIPVTDLSNFTYYLGSEYPTLDTISYYNEKDATTEELSIPTVTLKDNEVLLTKYNGTSKNVSVPNTYTIDGKTYNVILVSVVLFTEGVFVENNNIENVLLDSNIRIISIDESRIYENNATYLFLNCGNLVSVPVIPDGVTDLEYAFENCTSLVDAPKLPDTLKYMFATFSGCKNLVNAPVIPSSVEYMDETFNYSGVTGIVRINSSVVEDAMGTFYGTNNKIEVQVPAGSTTYDTFMGNDLPSNVTITTFE